MGCKTRGRKSGGRRGGGRGAANRCAAFLVSLLVSFAIVFAIGQPACSQCGPGGCPGGGGCGVGGGNGVSVGGNIGIGGGQFYGGSSIGGRLGLAQKQPTMQPVAAPEKYECVANINVKYANPIRMGNRTASGQRGSGVLAEYNNRVVLLTAKHVVTAESGVSQITATVAGRDYPVSVIAVDPIWDIAVCSIQLTDENENTQLAVIEQGDAVIQQPGNPLTAVGWGGNGPLAATVGEFRGYRGASQSSSADWLDMRGIARDGDSGGPIFNAAGRLVGILWGTNPYDGTITGAQGGRIWAFLGENKTKIDQTCFLVRRRPPPQQPPQQVVPPCCPANPILPAPLPVPPEPPAIDAPPLPVPDEVVPDEPKPAGVHPAWIAAGPVGFLVLFLTALLTFAIAHTWHVTSGAGAGVSRKRRG